MRKNKQARFGEKASLPSIGLVTWQMDVRTRLRSFGINTERHCNASQKDKLLAGFASVSTRRMWFNLLAELFSEERAKVTSH